MVIEGIIKHALKDAPVEACGYLGGTNGVIRERAPLTNVDNSHEHYAFSPQEQFDTVRAFRTRGIQLKAVYHSHPSTPARPSQEDIRLAFDPDLSYVIVSLHDGIEIKSFRISNNTVEEETLAIV
jgi:proteasome lid subunit RPN8/RPN11